MKSAENIIENYQITLINLGITKNEIIKGFVEDSLSVTDLKYEDHPSKTAINRWKRDK